MLEVTAIFLLGGLIYIAQESMDSKKPQKVRVPVKRPNKKKS